MIVWKMPEKLLKKVRRRLVAGNPLPKRDFKFDGKDLWVKFNGFRVEGSRFSLLQDGEPVQYIDLDNWDTLADLKAGNALTVEGRINIKGKVKVELR